MGCGSSTSTTQDQQQQPTAQQQQNHHQNKGRPTKSTRKKGDFQGVRSIDLENDNHIEKERNSRRNTSQFPNGIAHIYGFKARLKKQLNESTEQGNLEKVEAAIVAYEKFGGPEDDDYFRAVDRRYLLELQRGLRDAMRRRHVGTLNNAIEKVQYSPYHKRLKSHVTAAEELRDHLIKLEIHTSDILQMEQKTVSEIKSYNRPPECLYSTMKAAYILLGTPETKLRDWGDIQTLLSQSNKNSILYKIDKYDLDDANIDHALAAERVLYHNDNSYGDVLKASNGVAIFFLWTDQYIQQIKTDHQNKQAQQQQQNKRKKK